MLRLQGSAACDTSSDGMPHIYIPVALYSAISKLLNLPPVTVDRIALLYTAQPISYKSNHTFSNRLEALGVVSQQTIP
jgi:hypothetical protein